MKIALSIKQRLELAGVMDRHCRGKKKDPKRRKAADIIKKIEIPEDELALYVVDTPAGPWQQAAVIKRGPVEEIELTVDEARFLDATCEEGFVNLGPKDDEWVDDLFEKLEKASNGAAASAEASI